MRAIRGKSRASQELFDEVAAIAEASADDLAFLDALGARWPRGLIYCGQNFMRVLPTREVANSVYVSRDCSEVVEDPEAENEFLFLGAWLETINLDAPVPEVAYRLHGHAQVWDMVWQGEHFQFRNPAGNFCGVKGYYFAGYNEEGLLTAW